MSVFVSLLQIMTFRFFLDFSSRKNCQFKQIFEVSLPKLEGTRSLSTYCSEYVRQTLKNTKVCGSYLVQKKMLSGTISQSDMRGNILISLLSTQDDVQNTCNLSLQLIRITEEKIPIENM